MRPPAPQPPDLSELYRSTRPQLFATARRLRLSPEDAEDLVQHTFIVAQRRLSTFNHGCQPSSWLHGIFYNLYRNHRRAQRRAQHNQRAYAQHLASAPRPPSHASRTLVRVQLERGLTRLESRRVRVLVCADGLGMTGPELARTLGLETRRAYTELAAARRVARRALERPPPACEVPGPSLSPSECPGPGAGSPRR